MISTIVVDDEAMVRAGLRLLIDGEPDLEVLGEAADGKAGVELFLDAAPDVVLMDVRMPKMNGVHAAQQILNLRPAARVIILTTFDEDEIVDATLRSGVAGFLLKSSPPRDLLSAIRAAAQGHGVLDPAVVPRVIASYGAARTARPLDRRLELLTPREVDVLRLVGQGYSNSEIASALFLGEATVKTHLGRLLTKLDLRARAQAIAYAHQSGALAAP